MAEPLTKPCKCGCGEWISTATMKPSRWKRTRFAGPACAMRWRNLNDPVVIEGRRKGSMSREKGSRSGIRPPMSGPDRGKPAAPLSWLDQPPARIIAQRRAQGIVL